MRRRVALCERVLALDPNLRGLRSIERYERSRALQSAVVSAVEPCVPAGGTTDTARAAAAADEAATRLLQRLAR